MTATPGALAARPDDDALDNGIQAILDSANTGTINAQEAQLLLRHVIHAWASAWVDTEIVKLLGGPLDSSSAYHRSRKSSLRPKGQRRTAHYPVRWR